MDGFTIFIIAVSISLVGIILLQQKSSALGSMGGQDGGGEEIAQTRRGAEKFLHKMTILLVLIFMGSAVYKMLF